MAKIGKTDLTSFKKEKLIIPFGKYSGEYLEDVPIDYLIFLTNTDWFEEKYQKLFTKAMELIEEFEDNEMPY